MKRYITAAVVLGIVAILALVSVVSAQDNAPFSPQPWQQGHGRGMMGAYAGDGQMHDYMEQAMADALGLTVDELEERHANGETFWDITEEQGLTADEARQLMLDARSTALDKMVEDGVLTADQAEWMKDRGGRMMNGRGRGGCMGGYDPDQQGFGPGMRGGWNRQDG